MTTRGLSQSELLDLFDRTEGQPLLREAIRKMLDPMTPPTTTEPRTEAEQWTALLDDAYERGVSVGRAAALEGVAERECEYRRATPCKDRNGTCGTHLSPWSALLSPTPASGHITSSKRADPIVISESDFGPVHGASPTPASGEPEQDPKT